MHLNECFELAFSRPAADATDEVVNANHVRANPYDYPESDSSLQLYRPTAGLARDGSVLTMLQCIVSDWGFKSQTNFYIPPARYAGYSYLFEDDEQHSFDDNMRLSLDRSTHTHAHGRQAFVHAEEANNLHPHHYDVFVQGSMNLTHVPRHTFLMHSADNPNMPASDSMHNSLLHPIILQSEMSHRSHVQMTVPYIHPQLEMPVPPLQLPWHFGALCWSFTFGGLVMLYWPAKWALRSGGCDTGEREGYRRHWFPYFAFAWGLILVQGPCSFMADYVNMSNISVWHIVDRFIACLMMSLEVGKLIALRRYTHPLVYLLYLMCCGGAMFCFLKSQEAQATLNADDFVFWHNGWHLYPIAQTVLYIVDNLLNQRCGEYYELELKAGIRTRKFKYEKCERSDSIEHNGGREAAR